MWRPARFVSTLRVHRVNQGGGAGRVYKIQSPTTESSDLVVPSVTSVLNVLEKAALLPWAIRICLDDVRRSLKQHRNRAGDVLPSEDAIDKLLARAATAPDSIKNSSASFGTRVHAVSGIVRPDALNLTPNSAAQAIDAIITGMTPRPPVPSDIAATVAGFEAWYATSGIRFASAGDTMVYSREHGYAGAADCIGYRLDGSAIVVCDFKTSNSTQQSYALQLAAYATAIREMWNAGELDLNALLAADSRRPMPATTTETLPLTASSPDVIKHFTPNNIAHDVITDGESTANISLTTPVFDSLALGVFDPLLNFSAKQDVLQPIKESPKVKKHSDSDQDPLISNRITMNPDKPTKVLRKKPKTVDVVSAKSKEPHPVVDEGFLLGAIAAGDVAAVRAERQSKVASSAPGSRLPSQANMFVTPPLSRAYATVAAGREIAATDDFCSAGVEMATAMHSEPTSGINTRPDAPPTAMGDRAMGDPSRFSFCPKSTPIEAIIVRLDKTTGAVDVQRVVDIDAAFNGFKAALQLFMLLKSPRLTAQQKANGDALVQKSLLERV